MNEQAARTITPAPVRKSLLVKTSTERAFEVFTVGMSRWWFKQYSINRGSPIKDVVLEPRINGRWYEVGEDGSSCQWGKVLAGNLRPTSCSRGRSHQTSATIPNLSRN